MRLLPWFQEAARREPDSFTQLSDCETCMQENPPEVRQTMRCGFEVDPPSDVSAEAWQPPRAEDGAKYGYKGPPAEVCVGYTANLPEVLEVAEAHDHWTHGALDLYLEGRPNETLLQLVRVYEAHRSNAEAWGSEYARNAPRVGEDG